MALAGVASASEHASGGRASYNRAMPFAASALIDHLQQAARRHPDQVALTIDEQTLSWSAWLAQIEEVVRQVDTERPGGLLIAPCTHPAEALQHALLASWQNRAFWPVDPARPPVPSLIRSVQPPAATRLIISTSGSTGEPRAVCLGNEQLDAAARAANQVLDLRAGDCWLHCLPLQHIGGQAIVWRCLRAGARLLVHHGFDPAQIARDFVAHPVSHISLVPAMLGRLLDAGIAPAASLRCALIGGAALSPTLYERASAAGWPVYPSYGMSETAAMIACWQPGDPPWSAGQVGRLLPGHELTITREGCIRLRGPQVMIGTLAGDGPDAAGWLTTRDLGEIDTQGRLTVHGRADDLLISGGHKIAPQWVESCLAATPGIRDVALTARPDPVWGDRLVIFIVGEASEACVLAQARAHLPKAARPRQIRRIEALPRNAAGKLDRATLRQLASALPE